jgi:hypothetical protein
MTLAQDIESELSELMPTVAFFIDVNKRRIDIRIVAYGNDEATWDDVDPADAREAWNDQEAYRSAWLVNDGDIIYDSLPPAAVDAAFELIELIKDR